MTVISEQNHIFQTKPNSFQTESEFFFKNRTKIEILHTW